MKKHKLYPAIQLLKQIFVVSVIIYILGALIQSPQSMDHQYFDLRSAVIISLGFATSFRAMLWCRKKV